MSTSYYLKPSLSLLEIESTTPIKRHVYESGIIGLTLDGNYLSTGNVDPSEPITTLKRYGSNNPAPIFKWLIRAFDILFFSEYSLQSEMAGEYIIDDNWMREYRKGLVEEIQAEDSGINQPSDPGDEWDQLYDIMAFPKGRDSIPECVNNKKQPENPSDFDELPL